MTSPLPTVSGLPTCYHPVLIQSIWNRYLELQGPLQLAPIEEYDPADYTEPLRGAKFTSFQMWHWEQAPDGWGGQWVRI